MKKLLKRILTSPIIFPLIIVITTVWVISGRHEFCHDQIEKLIGWTE